MLVEPKSLSIFCLFIISLYVFFVYVLHVVCVCVCVCVCVPHNHKQPLLKYCLFKLQSTPSTVLATLVGVFSFVFGHLGPFPPFRIAVVMAVSAFNAPILCQYNGVDTGTIKFYVCMIINFTVGAVYTVIFNQLVLPW